MRTTQPPYGDPTAQVEVTDSQLRMLVGVLQGHTNIEIAKSEFVSPHTVKEHLHTLMQRTGTKNRAHLVAWAFESGLIRPQWRLSHGRQTGPHTDAISPQPSATVLPFPAKASPNRPRTGSGT